MEFIVTFKDTYTYTRKIQAKDVKEAEDIIHNEIPSIAFCDEADRNAVVNSDGFQAGSEWEIH